MTKYKKIAKELKKRILSGAYSDDYRLPNQETLAKEFNTSRMTIMKALDLLYSMGLIYTIQGSGTYIKRNALQNNESVINIGQNLGLTAQLSESMELINKTISFEVRFPNKEECDALSLQQEDPVYDIVRLRVVNGKPCSLEHTIFPIALVPGITEEILKKSVYDYINYELGIDFGEIKQTVRAEKPNENDQKYLLCKHDEPVLVVDKIIFTDSGIPIEFSKVRHRYDMVEMNFVNLNTKILR